MDAGGKSSSAQEPGDENKEDTELAKLIKQLPKKPMSGYFLYMEANRERVKAEHAEISSVAQVAKLLAAQWRELSDEVSLTHPIPHRLNQHLVSR